LVYVYKETLSAELCCVTCSLSRSHWFTFSCCCITRTERRRSRHFDATSAVSQSSVGCC